MTFLGFDVGGSQCRFEWWPDEGLRGGDAKAVQPAVHGLAAAVEELAAALRHAERIAQPTAAVCALAGVGDAKLAAAIAAGVRERGIGFPVAIVGDVLAAAAAGLGDGPGVLSWAGTGSFAIARAADGTLQRTGGRGYLLGDQGSGYDLVRRAAAAVLLAVDELGPATALTAALTAAFGESAPARLGAAMQQLAPGDVAARLPVVLATAAGGDAVANEVLQEGAEALAALAIAAVRRAGLDWRSLPVAFGGGVLTGAPVIAALLADRLRALGAGAPRCIEPRAAASAAARLAHGWFHRQEPWHSWVTRVAL